jgi:protein involved in polysaccharide export with SLBB domain
MNRLIFIPAGALSLALLAGCRHTGPRFDPHATLSRDASELMLDVETTNRVSPEWLRPPTNLFTIGPGDRLEIELFGDTESHATTLVGPDGKLYYHLLPGLDVWGLTLAEAKQRIETELLKFIREGPKVALNLRSAESKRVWLLGRLNAPGVYPMAAPMSLLEALSLARGPASGSGATLAGSSITISLGGATEDSADLRRSFVLRQGKLLPVDLHRLLREGDMTQNIYLEPDDFVYLPSAAAQSVYVLGAVSQPKAVPFTGQLTLIAAIAGASGTIKDAYLSHVAIVRGPLTQPQIAIVDYKDIVRGKGVNVVLAPHDIVYVPFAPYRIVGRYVELILQTFVRTVGANEGARAISPDSVPINPNVPIGGL